MDIWLLTGGFARLVVYRTDTGEAISTPDCAPVGGFEATVETRQLSDGTLDVAARTFPLDVLVCDLASVETLRRWRAELDAGADVRVRARLLASGSGPHLVWDEPVPPVISAVAGGRGGLSGERLTLHSGLYAPDVVQSPDLAARVAGGRQVPFGGDAGAAGGGGWSASGDVVWADAGAWAPTGYASLTTPPGGPVALVERTVVLPPGRLVRGGTSAGNDVRRSGVALAFSVQTRSLSPPHPVIQLDQLSFAEWQASDDPETFPGTTEETPGYVSGVWPRQAAALRLNRGCFAVRCRVWLPEAGDPLYGGTAGQTATALVERPALTTVDPTTRDRLRV